MLTATPRQFDIDREIWDFGSGVFIMDSQASADFSTSQALSPEDIIRAWEDPLFRLSLTPEQKARLPVHPSGNADQFASVALVGLHYQATEMDRANSGSFCTGNFCTGGFCTTSFCGGCEE